MKFRIAVIFALAAFPVSAQFAFDADTLSHEAKTFLSRIENDNSVSSDTMGLRFGHLPKDYPPTLLRERLALEELVALTNHVNPIVRCHSFKALTQRNEELAFRIVLDHFHDTVTISATHGCFLMDEFVGDYFVNAFRGYEAISHDTLHSNILDSLLIFTPNKLEARNGAIWSAGEKGKYYHRIREIAIHDKLGRAVIVLASFRREEDIGIILETDVTGKRFSSFPLGTKFFAISKFPHPKFLPFLESYLQPIMVQSATVESTFLYEAISNYNSKAASVLLARVFKISDSKLRQEHLERLSMVLKRNPNPVYNDLRKRIALEANLIN